MNELPENSIYRAQYLQALFDITSYPAKYNLFSVRSLHSCFNYSNESQLFDKLINPFHRLDYPMLSLEACIYLFKKTYGEPEFFINGKPAYRLRYRYRLNKQSTQK